MRNYREKLGRTLVALFFALPLITTPVYANDTIPEPGTDPGSEWSGEIVDPTPAPTPAPTPEPTPAPAPTPEPTPAPTPTPKAPKTTPKTVAPQTVVEETPEETKEEPQEEVIEEAPEEVPEETQTEEVPEETPEVPEAFAPAKSEDSIKAKIIALISTVIVAFSGLIIWAAIRLYRINKFEKIYRDALKRSHEIRKSGITRAG